MKGKLVGGKELLDEKEGLSDREFGGCFGSKRLTGAVEVRGEYGGVLEDLVVRGDCDSGFGRVGL